MNHEQKRQHQLRHLERRQQTVERHLQRQEEHFEKHRERLQARFAQMRARLASESGGANPSDDQQRIIAAALELLNEVGLADLSLRKLAAKLDFKAPAIYWHFESKEVLIDYMAEAILRSEFADLSPRKDGEAWQDWLVATCNRLRNAMRAYRDGARVVAGAHMYPAVTLMRIFEACMQSLTSAGLEVQRANLIIGTAVHFVFGNVIEEQASPTLEQIKQLDLDSLSTEFPLMAKSIELSLKDVEAGYDEFEDSLRLIVGRD